MIVIRTRDHAALVLRHLRTERGLSRRQLAARLFVSPKTVENREYGVRAAFTDEALDHVHALGYDLALVPRENAQAA